MSKRNMKNVRELLEKVWSEGDHTLLPDLVDENVSYHAMPVPETLEGIDQYRHLLAVFKGLYADLGFTVEDQFAGGGKVATRWVGRIREPDDTGEHEVEIRGITITEHDDEGRIVVGWDSWDTSKIAETAGGSSLIKQLSVAV